MDPSTPYQQQYLQQEEQQTASSQTSYVAAASYQNEQQGGQGGYQYDQQNQNQSTTTQAAAAAYYDQYYYQYNQQQQQQLPLPLPQQQYATAAQYYYSQDDYASAYTYQQQQYQPEPTSIHPPGVPIAPPETVQQAWVVQPPHHDPHNNTHNSYYYQQQQQQQQQGGVVDQQQQQHLHYHHHHQQHHHLNFLDSAPAVPVVGVPEQQWQGFGSVPMHTPSIGAIGQSPYRGGGRKGGKAFKGGGRGHFAPRPSAPARQALHMAWCDLCRVDCNTYEILEKHKSGKRHQKNLKEHERLQNLNKITVRGENSEFKPKVSGNEQPLQENVSSEAVDQSKVETEEQKVVLEEQPRKPRAEHFEARGRGSKRKMRGARGGKRMRTSDDESRRSVEPPKPKEVIPFICELCNAKCDTAIIFRNHLAGKKHLFNLQCFQDEQALLGQVALQALEPALQALYPAIQALCHSDPNAASSSFGIQVHPQGVHGSQGYFGQHGPSMFPQGQASVPPSVLESQEQQDSVPPQGLLVISSEAENENAVIVEANGHEKSEKVEIEAKPVVSNDKKSETDASETDRKEADTGSVEK